MCCHSVWHTWPNTWLASWCLPGPPLAHPREFQAVLIQCGVWKTLSKYLTFQANSPYWKHWGIITYLFLYLLTYPAIKLLILLWSFLFAPWCIFDSLALLWNPKIDPCGLHHVESLPRGPVWLLGGPGRRWSSGKREVLGITSLPHCHVLGSILRLMSCWFS